MPKLLVAFILFLAPVLLTASKNYMNNWYFGRNAGITFNTSDGIPVALTDSKMDVNEGSSVASDDDGALLFYSDGMTIWNRNHEVMENGAGLAAGESAVQGVLIIPLPLSDSLYYVFTMSSLISRNTGDKHGLSYSIVDMSRRNGLGEVIEKNTEVYTHTAERLGCALHANGRDYWLVIQDLKQARYRSYLLGPCGVQHVVDSYFPGIQPWSIFHVEPLVFSHDGRVVATWSYYTDSIILFAFNRHSGELSVPLEIKPDCMTCGQTMLEFSPDNSKLYFTMFCKSYGPSILQLDLDSSDLTCSVIALRDMLTTGYHIGLRLGPDDKIYVTGDNALGVIHDPDVAGDGCNFVGAQVPLEGGEALIALPYFPPEPTVSVPEPSGVGAVAVFPSVPEAVEIGQSNVEIPVYVECRGTGCESAYLIQAQPAGKLPNALEFEIEFDKDLYWLTSVEGSAQLVDNRTTNGRRVLTLLSEPVDLSQGRTALCTLVGDALLSSVVQSPIVARTADSVALPGCKGEIQQAIGTADGLLEVDPVCLQHLRRIRIGEAAALSLVENVVSDELTASFRLPHDADISLTLVNPLGQSYSLAAERLAGGEHMRRFDVRRMGLPRGQYFLVLSTASLLLREPLFVAP